MLFRTILCFFMAFGSNFLQIQASEWCNIWETDEFFCKDTDTTVGYCCNYYNFDYHNCCSATYVWGLWYFWLGLIGGLLCLTALLAGIHRCWKAKSDSRRNREARVATVTQQIEPESESATQFKMADIPPSYDFVITQQVAQSQLYPTVPNVNSTTFDPRTTQTSLVFENTPVSSPTNHHGTP